MKIRKRLTFHGTVQGVGFRYRARYAAQAVGATGWVRNDESGTVTMEIQGTQEQIDRVVGMISRGTFIDIGRTDEENLPLDEGERSFRTMP